VNEKVTILIPTRDRQAYLEYALRSCLNSSYSNLEVIVCDNSSTDDFQSVMASFQDSRLKYVKSPLFLSMVANWEFALSQVEDGYVSILGDDDAFLPDGIRSAMNLLEKSGLDAISWRQCFYRWPGNDFVKIPELYQIPLQSGWEIRSTEKFLPRVLEGKCIPGDLPWLYGGIVHIRYVHSIKKKSGGKFFHSRIPDIYSAMVLASEMDSYVFSNEPFSIAGHSAKSNGAVQLMHDEKFKERKEDFHKGEGDIPFHTSLEFIHLYPILVWEAYLQSCETGCQRFKKNLIVPEQQLRRAVIDAVALGFYEENRERLDRMARNLGCGQVMMNHRFRQRLIKWFFKFREYGQAWTRNVFINCQAEGFRDIGDAAFHHDRIRARYPGIFKAWIHNALLLLKRFAW
jgi:glycosyltransferase involved in cell wall biosynthesis